MVSTGSTGNTGPIKLPDYTPGIKPPGQTPAPKAPPNDTSKNGSKLGEDNADGIQQRPTDSLGQDASDAIRDAKVNKAVEKATLAALDDNGDGKISDAEKNVDTQDNQELFQALYKIISENYSPEEANKILARYMAGGEDKAAIVESLNEVLNAQANGTPAEAKAVRQQVINQALQGGPGC